MGKLLKNDYNKLHMKLALEFFNSFQSFTALCDIPGTNLKTV